MILKHPTQSKFVLEKVQSGKLTRIVEEFPQYESHFIGFSPFLKIKNGHESNIKFVTGHWPNKKEVLEHCERVSWTDFLKLSGMRDYISLERALSFYHRATSIGERTEYKKMKTLVEKTSPFFVPPQTDEYPDILINDLLNFLAKHYSGVFIHGEFEPVETPTSIKSLLESDKGIPRLSSIETTDDRMKALQIFDFPFTCYFGPRELISDLIKTVNLEGFFCEKDTSLCWADDEIAPDLQITWAEDMNQKSEK
jgi:hypothetical protein